MQLLKRRPWLGTLSLPVVVIALWVLITTTEVVDRNLFPSPGDLYAAFREILGPKYYVSIYVTVYELLVATGVFVVVSTLLGFLLGANQRLFRLTYGPIATLFAMPKITVLPLFVILFGVAYSQKIMFGALYGLFPLIMTIMASVRGIPEVYLNLMKSLGASSRIKAYRLVIPSILPSFLNGLRIGFIYAGVGILLSEMYVSVSGLGQDIVSAVNRTTLDHFWVYVITASIVMLIGATLLQVIESRFSGWRL